MFNLQVQLLFNRSRREHVFPLFIFSVFTHLFSVLVQNAENSLGSGDIVGDLLASAITGDGGVGLPGWIAQRGFKLHHV